MREASREELNGGLSLDPDLFLGCESADYYMTEGLSFAPTGEGRLQWLRKRNLGLLRAIPGADHAISECHPGEGRVRLVRRLRRSFTNEEAALLCQALGLEPGWFDLPHRASDIPRCVVRYCLCLSDARIRELEVDSREREAYFSEIRRNWSALRRASKMRRLAVRICAKKVRSLLLIEKQIARLETIETRLERRRTQLANDIGIGKHKRWSVDDQRIVVEDYLESDEPIARVASRYKLTLNRLADWVKLYQNGLLSEAKERSRPIRSRGPDSPSAWPARPR